MPTLYLHAGHSKTGTSWLQAALRENGAGLAAQGLSYPVFRGIGDEQGVEIGQGNGLALAAGGLEEGLRWLAQRTGPAGLVLSSEELFPRLSEYNDPASLTRAAQTAGFEGVEILLFIRNPVAHAASLWQQYLKRGGGSVSIEAFFERYSVPQRVAQFLDRFGALKGVAVTCLNYDRHRLDLLDAVCLWLGVPTATMARPRAAVVNRGMTRAELTLQAALNRKIGKAGRILSDALCEELPDLPSDRIRPDLACQQAMCERLVPTLARVNAYLDEEERYRPDIERSPDTNGDLALEFSGQQIGVIGAALGAEIRRLRQQLAALEKGPEMLDRAAKG